MLVGDPDSEVSASLLLRFHVPTNSGCAGEYSKEYLPREILESEMLTSIALAKTGTHVLLLHLYTYFPSYVLLFIFRLLPRGGSKDSVIPWQVLMFSRTRQNRATHCVFSRVPIVPIQSKLLVKQYKGACAPYMGNEDIYREKKRQKCRNEAKYSLD
jgi:hypothetical protein